MYAPGLKSESDSSSSAKCFENGSGAREKRDGAYLEEEILSM